MGIAGVGFRLHAYKFKANNIDGRHENKASQVYWFYCMETLLKCHIYECLNSPFSVINKWTCVDK